jgi:CheY-like chemotaxis protein/HPt (histidine-containing phosphotransfer) domain-containing protein
MEIRTVPIGALTKQKSVLLLEDDEISQQVEEWKLRKLGYQVWSAANGWEALEILQKNFCDALLMNCHLLEMDGLRVSMAIRSSDPKTMNPNIPIIALASEITATERDLCRAAGINDLLSRPLNSQELARKLEHWLNSAVSKLNDSASPQTKALEAEGAALDVFNEAELLERLMDDRNLERLILDAFVAELPSQILALKQYVLQRDAENARLQAHSMRGASANLAAHSLRDVFLEAESSAKKGDLDGMGTCISRIESEYRRFEQTIKKLKEFKDEKPDCRR